MRTRASIIITAALLWAGTATALPPAPATSLNTCQRAVKTAADAYEGGYVLAVVTCLQAISLQVIQNHAADAHLVASGCAIQFRKIYDTRGTGMSLGEKLTVAIDKKCAPGMLNVTHGVPDVLGPGAALSESIEATDLNAWCAHFGGDGSIGTLHEWGDCVAASHTCAAQQEIVTQYPRALEWLAEVKTSMLALTAPVTDPTKITDAVAGLNAVVAAIDGPDNDGQPNIDCGSSCGTAPPAQRLKTGQTTCYNSSGTVISCAGTGQDGELQKGVARSYTDNGDGTITDNKTGLMWEKKSYDGTIHDQYNSYTWDDAFSVFIAGLNAGGGFAGHTDWRLPNINELQSLADYSTAAPALNAVFNASCAASCTVLTCSCDAATYDWSSTSVAPSRDSAWIFNSYYGYVGYVGKTDGYYVRAVRGGS